MTEYRESGHHGYRASGLGCRLPVGKRFKSAEVIRRADNRWRHLGHFHETDGRWRVYVFADSAAPALEGTQPLSCQLVARRPASRGPLYPANGDTDAIFDTKVIYQQDYTEVEHYNVPAAFQPVKVPYGLIDQPDLRCWSRPRYFPRS